MHVHATLTRQSTWSKTALRWMPSFLGFPLGGLAAKILVGPVDDLAAAIAAGAISGIILGLAQWLGLGRTGPSPLRWIVATAAGFAVGLAAGAALVDYQTSVGALATQGAICGAAIGTAQAAVVRRRLGGIAWAWPPLLAGLWALGWIITSSAGIDVEAHYTVFGASGAIVVTAATSVLAIVLARRPTTRD